MNSRQARFLLRGYRSGGADANDPLFREALDQAAHDPALAAWFEGERKLDQKISMLLGEVRPPADLRDMILAGGRATGIGIAQKKRRRLLCGAAAAAAGFVMLFSLFTAWLARQPDERTLIDFALRDAAEPAAHAHWPGQPDLLQAWLSDVSWRTIHGLQVEASGLKAAGCRRLDCEDREVFETCFRRGDTKYHCYIARKNDFSSDATREKPFIRDFGPLSAALWTDDSRLYVMVSEAGRAGLEKIL